MQSISAVQAKSSTFNKPSTGLAGLPRLLAGVAVCVAAAGLSSNAMAGDVDAGKQLAMSCAGCHGATGQSAVPIYPNLAGQHKAYLEKQMKDFRDGKRQDPIMSPMAKALSNSDIDHIATFYAAQKVQ